MNCYVKVAGFERRVRLSFYNQQDVRLLHKTIFQQNTRVFSKMYHCDTNPETNLETRQVKTAERQSNQSNFFTTLASGKEKRSLIFLVEKLRGREPDMFFCMYRLII